MEPQDKKGVKTPDILSNNLSGETLNLIFCKNGWIRIKKEKKVKPKQRKS
jgi:hypothetical protein